MKGWRRRGRNHHVRIEQEKRGEKEKTGERCERAGVLQTVSAERGCGNTNSIKGERNGPDRVKPGRGTGFPGKQGEKKSAIFDKQKGGGKN